MNFIRLVNIARALDRGKGRSHISFIIKGNKVLSIGQNTTNKTHPSNLKYNYITKQDVDIRNCAGTHSELRAILNLVRVGRVEETDFTRFKMVNIRINKLGEVRFSKPCRGCQDMLRRLHFKEVWYSIKEDEFEKLNSSFYLNIKRVQFLY